MTDPWRPEGPLGDAAACFAQAVVAAEHLELVSATILTAAGATPDTRGALDALITLVASLPAAPGRYSTFNYWRSRLEVARGIRDQLARTARPSAGGGYAGGLSAAALAAASSALDDVRRLCEDLLTAAAWR